MHACTCANRQVCTCQAHVNACIIMHVCIWGLGGHVCMCACMRARVYVCVCMCVCVCVCVCVCMCVFILLPMIISPKQEKYSPMINTIIITQTTDHSGYIKIFRNASTVCTSKKLMIKYFANQKGTLHFKKWRAVANGTHKTKHKKIKTSILCTCAHCQLLTTDLSTNSSGSDNGNIEMVKKTHLISLGNLPLTVTVRSWVFNITIYVSPSLTSFFFSPPNPLFFPPASNNLHPNQQSL